VKPIALSSSLPTGPKVDRLKRPQPTGITKTNKCSDAPKLTRKDIQEIRKENRELRRQGLGDPEAEAVFEALAKKVLEEEDEDYEPESAEYHPPLRKKKKLSPGVELLSRMADRMSALQEIEKVCKNFFLNI